MRIRPYQPGDLDACRRLWTELVETHRGVYGDATIGGDEPGLGFDRYVAEFGAENVWVADEGEVVGLAGLVWHEKLAELEPIVVAAHARVRGIGRALAHAVVEEARRGGATRIFVRPTARNVGAIEFFHRVGFDVLGYLELQIDLEPHARRPGETIAGLPFRV